MPKRSRITDNKLNQSEVVSKNVHAAKLGREGGKKGGKARAEALSSGERKESARRAALARWGDRSVNIPQASHMGVLSIGQAQIACAVLKDEKTRVLTQGGFLKAIGRNRRPKGGQGASSVDDTLPFLAAKNLEPFIHHDLRVSTNPLIFRTLEGNQAYGYAAELLPEVCKVFVEARRAGALTARQHHVADQCELLLNGLATVGIIALVDEATGFQAERERDALNRILHAYIQPEMVPWEKRFPDVFYKELFRVFGWSYNPPQLKKPSYVGKLTNKLIYERLPPGVFEELKRLNPPNQNGNRPFNFHEFLSLNIGNPHLEKQLVAVITLLRISKNRQEFFAYDSVAFPPKGEQLSLALSLSEEED